MSQIIKNLAAGPVPPAVATSYVTNSGTAIPAANILNVLADDTTASNDNGIQTTGSGNTVTVELTNRIVLNVTTTDATITDLAVFTPLNTTGFTFWCEINAYDSAGNDTAGGMLIGIGKKSGGNVTIVGTNDVFDESDAALNTINWDVIASGGDVQFQVTGIALTTIVWKIQFEYIYTQG